MNTPRGINKMKVLVRNLIIKRCIVCKEDIRWRSATASYCKKCQESIAHHNRMDLRKLKGLR